MEITARVIEDTVNPYGQRLTTMLFRYPRFIHSEVMAHRVPSRCAASSRAIPIAKMVQRVKEDMAKPVHWGRNQKGMQAHEELSLGEKAVAEALWTQAAHSACGFAETMAKLGVHKQIANRLIENFQHIEVVFTSSFWSNFYALRTHEDAQPEFKVLAEAAMEAHKRSVPRVLRHGDWHLPFVNAAERASIAPAVALKKSAARCARTSYLTHEGKAPTLQEDCELFDRLVASTPKHASPVEHQARAARWWVPHEFTLNGNFARGWVQHRKLIPGENISWFKGFR